jgi:hypothetical protein
VPGAISSLSRYGRYIDEMDLSADYSSIPTMARRAVPMKHEAMLFNYRDEFAKGTF